MDSLSYVSYNSGENFLLYFLFHEQIIFKKINFFSRTNHIQEDFFEPTELKMPHPQISTSDRRSPFNCYRPPRSSMAVQIVAVFDCSISFSTSLNCQFLIYMLITTLIFIPPTLISHLPFSPLPTQNHNA